ncbi:MAG: histidinol dehydrogenase [Deltaproteobacteria bacterium]|nr:histidinol dehydrogenase [Deltaproteobacteria bacterium]
MKRLRTDGSNFAGEWKKILVRKGPADAELQKTVAEIVEQVRLGGDAVLDKFCKKFDGRDGVMELPKERLEEAAKGLDKDLLHSIELCRDRLQAQAERELPRGLPEQTDDVGVTLGRRVMPVRRAGIYVPGGRASYPSSLIMAAVPAKVAGVDERIVVSPLDPYSHDSQAVLAAAHVCDVSRFFVVGGAHAVAALAHGTERIPRVDVIVGPGNAYVAEAKRQVYGVVAIDGVAGPSEILIIADAALPPRYAALDLMAQAEHDPDARALLLTDNDDYADAVEKAIKALLVGQPRREIIEQSFEKGAIVKTRDLDEAAALAEEYAPEHLELSCDGAERLLAKIRNAGCVFMGPTSPEVLGDYMAGSNHVLPTAGNARFASPLSTQTFMHAANIMRATTAALEHLADATVRLAESEGLYAHAHALKIRLDEKIDEE